ncbi:hypothetical protein MRS44_007401 [Fusarium solani]|uniref:Mid2 domain-containing protein n=1 Tax=Fusarium solani TaxID=169388 RepID=A0A9P9H2S0_FUSSL|nr:uncharacterized protein B0J15DRAFT_52780 [Fusarium solani]KAH7249305.1 hypothetical protein B0J15DRAFT_52780 [Fusarium solani]KAJ3462615.1 hypothetical protein MRS44_007401 [Fusarium solani]
MQIRRLLFLGLLLGAEASKLAVRQNANSGANSPATTAEETEPTADATTAPEASPTEETTNEPAETTNNQPTSEPEPTEDSTTESSPTTTDSGDTTITRTVTVTDANVKTVSQQTTVMRTITSTVLVTSTAFETTTVTSSDAETATKTVYSTTTVWANEKRALNLAPRTVGSYDELIIEVPAPTITSVPESFNNEHYGLRAFRRGLEKRATITKLVTVTVGEDSGKTVVNTVARTVISTVSKETEVTKTITETEQAGAKTTVTSTGILTITSTRVTTGVVQTVTVASSGDYGSAGTGVPESDNNNNNSSSSGGGDGGLSTGAKAGIGAGAGVAGLLIIGALIWFCVKKRRNDKHKAEYDDVFGSSEVPVGGPVSGSGTAPNMSQVSPTTASSTLAPSRNPTKGSTPEGYRGTALGDGRAGFAKPQPYGRAYMPASPETNYSHTTGGDNMGGVSPETNYSRAAGGEQGSPNFAAAEMHSPANTAELASDSAAARWHQNDAAEIDGNQVTSAHGSSPPANVYEMPAQPYR